MFPKKNNEPQQKTADNKAGNVSLEEINAENQNAIAPQIGNEGMNDLLNSSFDPGMLKIANEDNMLDIDGLMEPEDEKIGIKKDDAGSESGDDGNNEIENDNIISTKSKKPDRKIIEDAKNREEDIIQEKDPVKIIEKAPQALLNKAVEEVEEDIPELEGDLIAEDPKRKKKKGGGPGGIEEVSDDMKPAEGFPFTPVKIPARKKAGSGSRFLTALAHYSGQTVGKLLGVICNAVYWTLMYLPIRGIKKLTGKAKNKPRIKPEAFQKKRRHDLIPGWGGRKFKQPVREERAENDPIEVDFRKIPGVWAQLTAGEAEDENGNPLDPVITVYVAEPREKSDATFDWDIGHTFIGLEFSHFSNVTNQFERYITKYGLFAPGGENAASYITGLHKNATVPAQLLNDKNYGYTISQSFPAKPKQVNDIMRASETYADKGYRLFDRNCTTFVRDMVVRTAHIKAAEHILHPEEIRMTNTMNLGIFGSAAFSPNAGPGMEQLFGELGAQKDMSYERIGNKRTNKEEYDRYKKSLKEEDRDWKKYGMSPNSAAENMRRVKGPDTGLINALNYKGGPDEERAIGIFELAKTYENDANSVNMKIREITPPRLLQADGDLPLEFVNIVSTFPSMAQPLIEIMSRVRDENEAKHLENNPLSLFEYDCVTLELLRNTRKELMTNIKDLNTLLFKYYQNDDRLHLPVIHLIALLNKGVEVLDETYRAKMKDRKNAGDLGNNRESMMRDAQTVSAGGKTVYMTGTHYESYLQIYNTPEKAVANYYRLTELNRRNINDGDLSKREKSELAKLQRIEKLAKDFDNSHNYLLDKQGYRQQDIDYAFSLGVKERQGGAAGTLFSNHSTASDIYKASFMEKIFGGMQDRLKATFDNEHLTLAQVGQPAYLAEWLDKDMNTAAVKNMNGMRMIITGLKRSLGDPNRDELFEAVKNLFSDTWFSLVFPQVGPNVLMTYVSNTMPLGFDFLMQDKSKKFPGLIRKLVDLVLSEDKKDSLMQTLKTNAAKQNQDVNIS